MHSHLCWHRVILSWGPTWFLPVGHFGLRHSTHVARTPYTAHSGGGHTSAPHWIRFWASPNRWVSIGKQAHAIVKTKDLYSAYCFTEGCTHHPLFCSRLSLARLLHSYMYALVIYIHIYVDFWQTSYAFCGLRTSSKEHTQIAIPW